MNSETHVKTAKGTELPLLILKGKPYLQVPHRIIWLREDHPNWVFSTTILQYTEDWALAKAEITDENGKLLGVAHKQEHRQHFADFIEKAETGAIGRAIGMLGYGTQFAEEFFEGDRLADAPIKPASSQQKKPAASAPKTNAAGSVKKTEPRKPPTSALDESILDEIDRPLTAMEKVELSKWKMPGGKFKDKKLGEVSQDDIMGYYQELKKAESSGQSLSDGHKFLMKRIAQYYSDLI